MTKILVVEDETILREELAEWLTFEGHDVVTAEDGIEGIKCALRDQPELIICDIMMPRLDGYGVLLEMRANRETAVIPFIFMTAKVSTEDIRLGMALGADDYITKPFRREEMLQAIQTRLEKKDIVEQKYQSDLEQLTTALEQEQTQRLLKSKLVAMFSHDFRNPLASIMSSVGIVRDYADRIDEERRLTHLNRIEASVRQLIQMLDDMLLLAQMDTNSLEPELEPLDLGSFLNTIIDEFQAIYSETHQLVFDCHFTGTAMADPRMVRQIASNLISNAVKYSPPGNAVHVTLDNMDDQYNLSVQDHGFGIPEADQPHLFNAFHRGSNVQEIKGTGLGLAIVQQTVDLLDGTINLESRVGEGTIIIIRLPLIKVEAGY